MNESVLVLLQALVRSARSVEMHLDSQLAVHGLSATRLWTLQRLGQPGAPLSPGQLAGCMAFARSNATQLVDHLEAAHLVQRVPDPQDRRSTHLAVTEQGRQNCAAALESLQPLLEQIEQALSPAEREQLAALLLRLAGALQ